MTIDPEPPDRGMTALRRHAIPRLLADGLVAGTVAAVLSGAPSTVLALLGHSRPLQATMAAGSVLVPGEQRPIPLLVAAVPVHVTISVGWGLFLALTLPRRGTAAWGAAAGLAIAAVDLGLAGRRLPRIRALPLWPQVADHVAFGLVAGEILARRRAGWLD